MQPPRCCSIYHPSRAPRSLAAYVQPPTVHLKGFSCVGVRVCRTRTRLAARTVCSSVPESRVTVVRRIDQGPRNLGYRRETP